MGEVDVAFYDRVVSKNSCDNKLYPAEYGASLVSFEVRPVQIEF